MAEGDAGPEKTSYTYIVVGGGIAGVTCAETLSQLCNDNILLLTASPLVKAVTNFRKVTKTLEEFDVEERPMFEFAVKCPNVVVKQKHVAALYAAKKELHTSDGSVYTYTKLCICTGGSPKMIARDNPLVIGIRDTETVKVFQEKLHGARRIIIVGNGGIATELAYEVEGCEVIWAIKDDSITSAFIDVGAATFFLDHINKDKAPSQPVRRSKYRISDHAEAEASSSTSSTQEHSQVGSALGPDWHADLPLKGQLQESRKVHVEYKVEVERLLTPEELLASGLKPNDPPHSKLSSAQEKWPIYVVLTNGKVYGCDFVVSATGVTPNVQIFLPNNNFDIADGKWLKVNEQFQTSHPDVYSAGDCCVPSWELSQYWLQKHLWSQARQMGAQAARCMVSHNSGEMNCPLDFCFEMFAHVTNFFNFKVVLLGNFNAQGLGKDHELLVRVTKDHEYVKAVMKDGRMHGAVLIGDTDLEETFENLILNQIDLSMFGEDLLDPNIDIEDFFD